MPELSPGVGSKGGENNRSGGRILVLVIAEEFGEAPPGAIDAAFHRAELCSADLRCFLVAQAFSAD